MMPLEEYPFVVVAGDINVSNRVLRYSQRDALQAILSSSDSGLGRRRTWDCITHPQQTFTLILIPLHTIEHTSINLHFCLRLI